MDEAVSDIDESVQRLLAKAMDDVAAEQASEEQSAADEEEDTIPLPDIKAAQEDEEEEKVSSRIDFGSLQFGRDYEIK